MVTHGRRHTAEQGRHLGTCLRETEDVVDEEQDVAHAVVQLVAERLGHGQAREGHRDTCSRRLVHLAEDQGGLRGAEGFLVDLREVPVAFLHGFDELVAIFDDARLDHLAEQVVTLTGTLAHAGEDRVAVISFCDVVDELHDEHRLAHASAAEEADLTALQVRLQQVDDLDAGEEHLLGGGQVFILGRFAVDGVFLFAVKVADAVDGVARHVEQASLDLVADRDGDGLAQEVDFHATHEAVGGVHGDGTHRVLADVLLALEHHAPAVGADYLKGVVDLREVGIAVLEVDVDHGADNLCDSSF